MYIKLRRSCVHGRGSSNVDLYIYIHVVRDECVRLPLDEFTMGVLKALNMAPS